MTQPDDPAQPAGDPLERAQARLDEACARVAARFDELAGAEAPAADRGLETRLSEARRREAALSEAAEDASRALGEAIAELQVLRGERL